jgi:hypothetical protein
VSIVALAGCGEREPRTIESTRLAAETAEVTHKVTGVAPETVEVTETVERSDAIPRHWIPWIHQACTRKTADYLADSRSVVVLGYQAWDDVHELVILKGDTPEYPLYQRMRLFARRVLRLLQGRGHGAVVYPCFLPNKRMVSSTRLLEGRLAELNG